MKRSLKVLFIILLVSYRLQAQHEHTDSSPHHHSHYLEHLETPAHKLIFPSSTPDRIISNLTDDQAHTFAVNWRTDQYVSNGVVEVALATEGPEFLLGDIRRIKANSQKNTTSPQACFCSRRGILKCLVVPCVPKWAALELLYR